MSRKFLVFMTALALGGATLVTGCGGGGGSSSGSTPPASSAISGVVADGFIQGATVTAGRDTADAVTNSVGQYTFSQPVTVGTVIKAKGGRDVDSINSSNTFEYATVYEGDDTDEIHIHPLTTLYVYDKNVLTNQGAALGNVKTLNIAAPGNEAAQKVAWAVQSTLATINQATGNAIGDTDTGERTRILYESLGEVIRAKGTQLLIDTGDTGESISFDTNDMVILSQQLSRKGVGPVAVAQAAAMGPVVSALTQKLSTQLKASVKQRDVELAVAVFDKEVKAIAALTTVAAIASAEAAVAESAEAKALTLDARVEAIGNLIDSFEASDSADLSSILDVIKETLSADTIDTTDLNDALKTVNYAPQVVQNAFATTYSLTVGEQFTLTVSDKFTDANAGDTLEIAVTGLPQGLSYTTGSISGAPTAVASSTVTVKATDPKGAQAIATFAIVVTAAPTTPVDPDPIDPADCAVDYPPVQGLPSDFYPPKVVEACYPDNLFPPTPGL